MESINDLLGFHFQADVFAKMGNNVINNNLITEIEKKTSELIELSKTFDDIGSGVDKSIDIEKILKEINSQNKLPEIPVDKEKKVFRTLGYYLSEIKSDDVVTEFLLYIDEKWGNSYFLGLVDYVFQFWNPLSSRFCEVRDFLKGKLQKYDGTNPRYVFLRQNLNCLDDNGPVTLGAKLKVEKKDILSCTEVLGMPEEKITYNYFSDAIYSYYKYKFDENVKYESLVDILNRHNNALTDKSVIPLFITKKKDLSGSWKDVLESLSKQRIGDCENNAKWSLPAEVETERHEMLKEAQDLIRVWTNEKYISLYFEKCVGETERKLFWLRYINQIEKIRIAGSKVTKGIIETNSILRQLLDKFILATNNTSSDTSAIIMKIRGKIYIEFSVIGNALYVYEESHLPIDKLFSRTFVPKITNLKQTDLGMLIDITSWGDYHNDYGRLFHKGEWQYRLSNYISHH